jgi:hypothetical protein
MKALGLSQAASRRLLAGAGAIVLAGAVSGVALGADATTTASAKVIKGCYSASSGALRVLTSHSKSCGKEKKISWNSQGPAGNGFAFGTTGGKFNKYLGGEADGPVVSKAGTYFVNVTGTLNIAAYTSGGSGFCALDLAHGSGSVIYVFEIFSTWDYPAAAIGINNAYPFASGGMVHVSASQTGDQFVFVCFDNSFQTVKPAKATWLVSPVSATTSAVASAGHSTLGPAGFRPRPARSS